jgi:peptide deformylase
MHDDLKIILWPDPRLKKISKPVEAFDENLRKLIERMFVLMRESKGVGLAAPQVGENIRLFVMNPNGEAGNDRVYVNPLLSQGDGEEEGEEGCLSLPKVNINVWRNKTLKVQAQDAEGKSFEQTETGYLARIWQHEVDHLNGILLTDRMGPVARMANRKILRELEEKYETEHPPPPGKKKQKK